MSHLSTDIVHILPKIIRVHCVGLYCVTGYITCTTKTLITKLSTVLFSAYYLGNSFPGICFEGSFTHKLHSISLPVSSDSSDVSTGSRGLDVLLS